MAQSSSSSTPLLGAMRHKRTRLGLLLGLSATLLCCDWRAFEDLENDAPVVALNGASGVSRSGSSVAAGRTGDRVFAYLGGNPGSSGGAVYTLGLTESPVVDASQQGYCDGNSAIESCMVVDSAAFFPIPGRTGELDTCFAYGWGVVPDDSADPGILVRCQKDLDATLTVPLTVRRDRTRASEQGEDYQPLWLASDPSSKPMLVAGSASQNKAWFYQSGTQSARVLTTPDSTADGFGTRTAVGRLADDEDAERLAAVSAPDAGQVWLYRVKDTEQTRVGCLGSSPGFGRALTMGRVDEDDIDDLVVADSEFVTVFSGAALAELPEAFDEVCTLAALPAGAVLASFGCGSRLALSGCDKSDFGASLAVADLDGDGDGEVLVGAPAMRVNGYNNAGAVLAYDAEGKDPNKLGDVFYLSSAEADDRFGVSLARVEQEKRDVFLAGAAQNSRAAIFYCSEFLSDDDRTGRCAR